MVNIDHCHIARISRKFAGEWKFSLCSATVLQTRRKAY